jgi:hypothetical protein
MAADYSKPVTGDTYTNVLQYIRDNFDAILKGNDPALVTPSSFPTDGIRWYASGNKWQKYNGTTYDDLSTLYAINISGNAGTVTNGVYTSGSYDKPSWLTHISGSIINAGTVSATYIDTAIARLASPTFTGTPVAPTPATADNTTKLATTAFVKNVVASYAPLASPALTGTPTAPTAAVDTNTTQVATTAFVIGQGYLKANGGTATNVANTDQTLTDGASVDWDCNSGSIATLTLTSTGGVTRTMNAPTNQKKTTYILYLIQGDATARGITWNSVFKFPSGVAPSLSSGTGKVDILSFISDGTNMKAPGLDVR